MTQYERYEYLTTCLKETLQYIRSNECSISNTQDTSQIFPNSSSKTCEDEKEWLINAVKDSITTLKIYKELRKIINWDTNIPISDRTAWIQRPDMISNKLIDSKWRLTFVKWISKILMILSPKVTEFKEIRLICNQMRRVEKIWSPIRSKKNIH